MSEEPEVRVERVLEVVHSFAEAEERDRQYWWSRTPEERLSHMEVLRRLNYGEAASTGRLQRFLEVAQRP
jgi:hypothetical protein